MRIGAGLALSTHVAAFSIDSGRILLFCVASRERIGRGLDLSACGL